MTDAENEKSRSDQRLFGVVRGGVEPPTSRFSVARSYQLSYLTGGLAGRGWPGQERS